MLMIVKFFEEVLTAEATGRTTSPCSRGIALVATALWLGKEGPTRDPHP